MMMPHDEKDAGRKSLMSQLGRRSSPESKMQEAMTRKMNIGRVLYGPKGMIGPPKSMGPKRVMTQDKGMMSAGQAFMEGQKQKAEEKEAGRKARLNKPKDEATEYYKQMARDQRKARGMD